ncbi:MAG: T9SS type A sorting domain-containing protein [Bacteroidia bacterium]
MSKNGYLTFNTSKSVSEVPDSLLPENSIVAFGYDFKLQQLPIPNQGIATQVFAYTVGKAPFRSHIIQYYGLSKSSDNFDQPINNASIFAFAIILHEGNEGRFDLVYSPYGDRTSKGLIGCSSASNQKTYILHDSLNLLPFQYSFNLNDFIVYQFYNGEQQNYDLKIRSFELSKIYPVNSIVNFKGQLTNWGKKSVQSYYLNYSVNASDTISYLINQVNLLPNGEGKMNFTHPISWLGGIEGSLNEIDFWLSLPNDSIDGDPSNSHYSKTILRNSNKNWVDRNLLLEEATGAWCGYCPDANLLVNTAQKQYGKRVIPVSYHFDDSMSNTNANDFLVTYITSYPDALLDRKIFLGSNSTWLSEINSRLNIKAPVELTIENKSFDGNTRTISYTVKVKFKDYWYGNLNIGSIVTEDEVRGNANPNLWSQNNYYSKDHGSGGVGGSTHPLYNELEMMDGYYHHSVHKASPGGVWGVSGKIPQLVMPNSEYTADFSYKLPEASLVSYQKENNTPFCSTYDEPGYNEGSNIPARINLIAYVSDNATSYFERPILNAVGERLWNLSNVNSQVSALNKSKLYPNPTESISHLDIDNIRFGNVKVELVSISGQVIPVFESELSTGLHQIDIQTDDIDSGIYALQSSEFKE